MCYDLTDVDVRNTQRGPPTQATGPPGSGAGVGVGMLRGARNSLI